MKTITQLKELESIPLIERRYHYIPESISTSYPIKENNEQLIDLKQVAKEQSLPLHHDTEFIKEGDSIWMRKSAANRLLEAIKQLQIESNGELTLKIYETFRPLSLQREQFNEIKEQIKNEHDLDGQELWEKVTQFIADPDLCPPHSTGGAIDCTIVHIPTNTEVDMGTPMNTISDAVHSDYDGITNEQKEQRQLLYRILTDVGFVNLPTEWWHFSYGDQYWAAHHLHEYALYGSREDV